MRQIGPPGRRYSVGERIGGGAQGTILPAVDPDGRACVVKVTNEGHIEAARLVVQGREIHDASRQQHANIVEILDFFTSDGLFYIVLERCDGSLSDLLASEDTRGADWIIPVAEAILPPLANIHLAGFLHTDLNPDNILFIGPSGPRTTPSSYTFKLADFGLGGQWDNGRVENRARLYEEVRDVARLLLEVALGSNLPATDRTELARGIPIVGRSLMAAFSGEYTRDSAIGDMLRDLQTAVSGAPDQS